METRFSKYISLSAVMFCFALFMGGCGGSTTPTTTAQTGPVNVSLVDAPNSTFVHVWITVKEVWFHTSNVAGTNDAGWLKFPLKDSSGNPTAVTVDLAALANGVAPKTIWGNIALPVGNYQQIRIFLADTDNETLTNFTLPSSVEYNNEVDYLDNTGTMQQAPLEIPASDDGISIIPETPVVVTATSNNKLVLDFNLNNDIIGPLTPKGITEFVLKPRLKYFDQNQAGIITGTIAKSSFSNYTGFDFVVKAERLYNNPSNSSDPNNGQFYEVRRETGLATTGQFTLSPVPVFGNATTAVLDVMLRGRNVQTYIVQGVKVHKGGTTNLGTITMPSGPEYTAQLQNTYHPTGAWINFYQSVNGSKPYEIRVRHLDPYADKFDTVEPLSAAEINVATWQNATPITFAAVTPDQGAGTFWTAPWAEQYAVVVPTSSSVVTGTAGQSVTFAPAALTALPSSNSITMAFMFPAKKTIFPTKGQLFITHSGLIVDSLGSQIGDTTVATAMNKGGGIGNPLTVSNIPGGSATVILPGAFYGLYAAGWGGGGGISLGSTHSVDLRSGSQGTASNPIQIQMH
jgi:hypothetical protein